MKTFTDFRAWLTDAKAGDYVVYYLGELALNRASYDPDPETPGRYDWHPVEPLDSLAKYVWAAQEAGLVYLTQRPSDVIRRKTGERDFFYYATRSHHSAEDCGFAL